MSITNWTTTLNITGNLTTTGNATLGNAISDAVTIPGTLDVSSTTYLNTLFTQGDVELGSTSANRVDFNGDIYQAAGFAYINDVTINEHLDATTCPGGLRYVRSTSSSAASVTTSRSVNRGNSSGILFLDAAGGLTITLPTLDSLSTFSYYIIKVKTAPTGADYIIAAASGTPIHGMLLSKDLNSATDSGATAGTGVATIHLKANKSKKGDTVELECDGTSWYAICYTGGDFDAITFT